MKSSFRCLNNEKDRQQSMERKTSAVTKFRKANDQHKGNGFLMKLVHLVIQILYAPMRTLILFRKKKRNNNNKNSEDWNQAQVGQVHPCL